MFRNNFTKRITFKGLFILLALIVLTPSTYTQEYKLCFEEFVIEDGFASVNAILRDRDGFMWFGGTQGLYRYDGYGFKSFNANFKNKNSLSDNNVICLYEDDKGYIWVGTMQGGINRYNPINESFTNYKNSENPIYTKNYITAITQDQEGVLWFGSFGDGVYALDKNETTYTNYKASTSNIGDSVSNNDIFSVLALKNKIWITSNAGILDCYDKETGNFQHYRFSDRNYQSARSGQRMCQDYRNNIWIATEEEGVFKFNSDLEMFKHYKKEKEKPSISTNTITDIKEGVPGEIWMTTGDGLNLLNSNTGQISVYKNDSYDKCSIANNIAYSLFIDEPESIWIGMGDGTVNKTISSSFDIFQTSFLNESNGLSSNVIGSLWIQDDILWIGTGGGGLNRLDTKTGKFSNYRSDPVKKGTIPSDIVMTLFVDKENTVWTGNSRKGLLAFMKKHTDIFREPLFLPEEGKDKIYNQVFDFVEDDKNNIWIATYNDGLYRYSKDENTYITFNIGKDGGKLISNKLLSLLIDRRGKLWIGSLNKGVQILDLTKERFESVQKKIPKNIPISDYPIKDIYEAYDGSIWIASGGAGVFSFYPEGQKWEKLSTEEGLPTNSIYGITQDNMGNFWFSSNKGLINYDLKNNKILTYDTNDGLPTNDFESGAIAKAQSGKLYFGSKKGLVAFYPHQLHTSSEPQNSKLVNLRIFNETIDVGDNIEGFSPLDSSIVHIKMLELPYYLNNFTLDFATPSYPTPHNVQYTYRLEGLEERWINTSSERHFASYSNVPPGKYEFKLRTYKENNKSDYDYKEKKLIITIIPVWWQTRVAYLCYTLMVIALIYFVSRILKNRIRLKNQLLLEKISHKKDKELHRLKINFFTTISHELRTSITLILTPLSELARSKGGNNRIKNLVMTMDRNGQRLLGLVNQVLDFRKMEYRADKLRISLIDLSEFFQEVCLPFKQYAKEKSIVFKIFISKNCKEGWVDPERLEIITYNLISNAFKFAEKEVSFSILMDKENKMLIIHVRDDGKGISQDNLEKIFDDFYQVEKDYLETGVGTGLGLTITKNFVQMHKGTIEVKSQMDKFTQFVVSVPIRKFFYAEEDIQPPMIKEIADEISVKNRKNIVSQGMSDEEPLLLIVEDNFEMRNLVQDSFSDNYRVYTASNGQEGYDRAMEVIPNIIITDIMMPELNGLELCEKLKTDQRTSHIPIILLTARSSSTFKMGGFEYGADDYVTKPFDVELLKTRVENLVGTRRMLREKFQKEILLNPKDIAINNVDEKFLEKIMSLIESNISDSRYSVSILAKDIGMSHSVLYRKIMALSGQNINAFIKLIRLKRARQLLGDTNYIISEISDLTGFSNPKYFSTCFKKYYGITPTNFRQNKQ